MRDAWALLKNTFDDWYEDRAQRLGAALAYYTIFAITPGLLIAIALAGLLLGPGAEREIIEQVHDLIGAQGAKAIEATVQSARTAPPGAAGVALASVTLISGSGECLASCRTGSTRSGAWHPSPGGPSSTWSRPGSGRSRSSSASGSCCWSRSS